MVDPGSPPVPSDSKPTPIQEKAATISESTRADEIGSASFPASDPPAVWTWEVKSAPTAPEVP